MGFAPLCNLLKKTHTHTQMWFSLFSWNVTETKSNLCKSRKWHWHRVESEKPTPSTHTLCYFIHKVPLCQLYYTWQKPRVLQQQLEAHIWSEKIRFGGFSPDYSTMKWSDLAHKKWHLLELNLPLKVCGFTERNQLMCYYDNIQPIRGVSGKKC